MAHFEEFSWYALERAVKNEENVRIIRVTSDKTISHLLYKSAVLTGARVCYVKDVKVVLLKM